MIPRRAPSDTPDELMEQYSLFNRVLPSDPLSVRQLLVDLRNQLGRALPPDAMGRVELVLAEIMNNIVNHGAPDSGRQDDRRARSIHISVACHTNGVACAILDDGAVLPARCLSPPTRQASRARALTLPEGGFGWLIIHDLTQSLAYFREEGFNLLAFNVPMIQPESEG